MFEIFVSKSDTVVPLKKTTCHFKTGIETDCAKYGHFCSEGTFAKITETKCVL